MNASLLPTHSGGAVYYEYQNNTFDSLPKALKKEGYKSFSYHGFQGSFWNREIMHKSLGFDDYSSMEDFDIDEEIGFGLSDASFFRQAMAKNDAMRGGDSPYYNFLITLSSHHPYEGFYTGKFTKDTATDGILTRYYNSAYYADQTLSDFFESLKTKGLYEDAVFVIYGDHAGLFSGDSVSQMAADGIDYSEYGWAKYMTVPAMIHVPGYYEEGIRIDKPTGQIDLLPTLVNMMSLEMVYMQGSDVLDETYESLVVKRFGDVITNEFIYLSDNKIAYDFESGEILPLSHYEDKVKEAHHKLAVIDRIYLTDFF